MKKISVVAIVIVGLFALAGTSIADNGQSFKADLSGAEEVPEVVTDTTGRAHFVVNRDETEIKFKLDIKNAADILGVAGAHIHCAPAGQNGPVAAFLAGAAPGGFDGDLKVEATLTAANIVNPVCGATIAELVDSMRAGNTYVNAHSPAKPGGEIRGQIK